MLGDEDCEAKRSHSRSAVAKDSLERIVLGSSSSLFLHKIDPLLIWVVLVSTVTAAGAIALIVIPPTLLTEVRFVCAEVVQIVVNFSLDLPLRFFNEVTEHVINVGVSFVALHVGQSLVQHMLGTIDDLVEDGVSRVGSVIDKAVG